MLVHTPPIESQGPREVGHGDNGGERARQGEERKAGGKKSGKWEEGRVRGTGGGRVRRFPRRFWGLVSR